MLLDAVKRWNGTSDYISQLYKDIEDNTLVPAAKKLAEEIFQEALHKDNLEKDLVEIVSDPDVAEETMEAYPPSWDMEVSDKAIDEMSKANKIDMSRTLEDGTKEYIDVTEMPITAMEQHGISSVPKALQDSIDGLTGQNDKAGLRTIKKEVINLFINNIDRDNKIIDILVKKAEETSGGKKVKTFEALLKEAAKKLRTEEEDTKKISRKEISSWADVKEVSSGVGMGALQSAHDSAGLLSKITGNMYTSKAAMTQVIHMLASMGDAKASSFRQGMRVTEPDKHGRSVYASVPLKVSERMRFLKGPVREGTIVRAGFSHTLMLAEKERGLSKVQAASIHRKMHQSFSRAKINGIGDNGRVNAHRSATLGVQAKGSHHSTTVTYSPKGMAAILEKAGKAASWDISKINKNAKTLMRDSMFSWGGRTNNSFNENTGKAKGKMIRQKGNPREGARFWALPYIGVLDNQYHEAAKKKKK
jgi:hypothetical protein